MSTLSWTAAIKLVASAKEANMASAAEEAIERIPREEWRSMLLGYLIADARRVQREDTLRAERNAEQRQRRVRAEHWKAWGEQRRAELGLPKDAGTGEMLSAAFKRYEDHVKMEWTRELLLSTFTLKDGRKVSWGEATVAQHLERIKIFTDQADINMQGAERHRQAIRDIKHHKAACLDDVCAATALAVGP